MSSLHLETEIPTDPYSEKAFPIFREYLQPDTRMTLQSAANSILGFLPDKKPLSTDVLLFCDLCIELAEQIPYHHPSQLKLAGLLEYIGHSTNLGEICQFRGSKFRTFHRYVLLGQELRETLNGPDPDHLDHYVNFHAFAANLHELRVFPSDPTWAIWAQRDAHEGFFEDFKDLGSMRDIHVLSAAQWILWGGQSFFKQILFQVEVDEDRLNMWSPGRLYTGTKFLSLHRWQFWKDAYRTIALTGTDAEKGGYGEECRTVSAKAAEIMECLEKNMTF